MAADLRDAKAMIPHIREIEARLGEAKRKRTAPLLLGRATPEEAVFSAALRGAVQHFCVTVASIYLSGIDAYHDADALIDADATAAAVREAAHIGVVSALEEGIDIFLALPPGQRYAACFTSYAGRCFSHLGCLRHTARGLQSLDDAL
ncbi:hypothetical protein [Methylosinus sp. Sm6]|uniref:hypothetical protein n=1 Tax=Methylosinus sp. Sm6 TaxID=2866948 RepID=UPI001C99649F|nr:hypothetical protein [Methylosinus sp. Sm6]MBY6243239.1 hypothetical protein [Methylosinus sp. Sm6]